MGQHTSRTDFEWVYTEEPHATRRKEMLSKYPEIKKLFGHDPSLKYKVVLMVLFQISTAWFFGAYLDLSWPTIFLFAYLLGGVVNHSMTLAIHEIAHNLAFGHSRPLANRFLGMFANLPIMMPMSISFKKYHLLHHRYQGDDQYDMDIPSRIEGKLFYNSFTKFIWVLFQPFFYAFRPLFLMPMPVTKLELLNGAIQFAFDFAIFYFFSLKSLIYLLSGTFLSMGLHPVAGHFISEHYMFKKGYETYSYYGILNCITFNVGYHNEHHDFPSIPGCRLPQVKKIAPEYYDNIPCHHSWSRVLYDFIFDKDIGPYARVKRRPKSTNGKQPNGDQILETNGAAKNGAAAKNGTTGHNGYAAHNGKDE